MGELTWHVAPGRQGRGHNKYNPLIHPVLVHPLLPGLGAKVIMVYKNTHHSRPPGAFSQISGGVGLLVEF